MFEPHRESIFIPATLPVTRPSLLSNRSLVEGLSPEILAASYLLRSTTSTATCVTCTTLPPSLFIESSRSEVAPRSVPLHCLAHPSGTRKSRTLLPRGRHTFVRRAANEERGLQTKSHRCFLTELTSVPIHMLISTRCLVEI